jgi:glyoxylase-like metal-dependent hydrolase (beta-lactamase superfamily II)
MIEEILPNLYRMEIPLPDSPLRALNSYVIKALDRNLIIDTGWNRQECMNAMQAGLRRLSVNLSRTDFFITHGHGDHLGLVPSLAPDTSTIYFNQPDADWLKNAARWNAAIDFARVNGFPDSELRGMPKGPFYYKLPFTILREGDTIGIGEYQFRCVETPGHTQGHMCLYEPNKKLLVAGDHILNDITPNITSWSHERNPLKEYLASLDKVYEYDVALVLPGHRGIFRRSGQRIQELKQHHHQRAEEVLSILNNGRRNAFQVASQMSWDIIYDSWDLFPLMQKWFATGEVIAHLNYLEDKGMVRRETLGEHTVFSVNINPSC